MSIETEDELEGLRRAGRVVADVLRELRRRRGSSTARRRRCSSASTPPPCTGSPRHGGCAAATSSSEEPSIPNSPDLADDTVPHAGLVITVEPIPGAGGPDVVEDDGWTIRTADGALAAHAEHTIVVTGGRPLVLTA